MRTLILLISLISITEAHSRIDLNEIQAPNSGGDSVSEVLGDMQNGNDCLAIVDEMDFLSEDEKERADDQCFDQSYEGDKNEKTDQELLDIIL